MGPIIDDWDGWCYFSCQIQLSGFRHRMENHHSKNCEQCNRSYATVEKRMIHEATVHNIVHPMLTVGHNCL